MPKIQIPKKIREEDFKSDQQEFIAKLGFVINPFMDDVYNSLNKGIDYENLKRQLVDIDVRMDAAGKVMANPQIKISIKQRPRGISVLNAVNLQTATDFPTATPFISWTLNGEILTILSITGLQANSQYRLTLDIVYG